MSAAMPCGVTADLRAHEAQEERNDRLMTIAEARRPQLVGEFIADPESKNQDALLNHLADLAAGDATFLHGLQRIHAIAAQPITPEAEKRIASTALSMLRLFRDHVDTHEGEDLVQDEADTVEAEIPCRCRGEDCYC